MASERGKAQTDTVSSEQALRYGGCTRRQGVLLCTHRVKNLNFRRRSLERATVGGESPVVEGVGALVAFVSTTGHEKSSGNLGGPPPKAKYL